MRVAALVIVAVLLAGPIGAGAEAAAPTAQSRVARELVASLAAPGLSLERTAAIAIDLRSGETIFAHRPDRPMIPASNEKLPVTFVALLRLGPGFTFHTDVVGLGHRRGPAWVGDLVLKGYGDPTFDTAKLQRLVTVLRGRGIRSVTGDVKGDESFFDGERGAPGWKPSFVGEESAPLSALVLDGARGWPAFSPAVLAARAFREALRAAGIAVAGVAGPGVVPDGGPVLASVRSAPLKDVVQQANSDSDNFVAEMLLKQLGAVDAELGTTANGAAAVMETLAEAGVPTAGVRIVDGSGLSALNRITPRALVAVLRAGLRAPGIGAAFRRSLAVAGRSGTLRQRLYPLEGSLRGKTGTTSLSCALTGMIRSRVAFAVLENGKPVASWTARAAQDRFALLLARAF